MVIDLMIRLQENNCNWRVQQLIMLQLPSIANSIPTPTQFDMMVMKLLHCGLVDQVAAVRQTTYE